MAETVTSLIVKLTCLVIKDHIKIMYRLPESIDSAVLELKSMEAFLKVANTYEDTGIQYEIFVHQVRDLAFKVEDVIDGYIMLSSVTSKKKGLIDYCLKQATNLGAKHSISEEIERIKLEFEETRKRHNRYADIKTDSVLERGSTSSAPTSKRWYNPQEDGHFQEDMVGIKGPKEDLIKRLLHGGSELEVVPVVGMGGMGKTALVRKVYEDVEVKRKFTWHFWINVSTNSTSEELFKDLIEKICNESGQPVPHKLDTMKSLALKQKIQNLLEDKKYVVVLDDVQDLDKWNACRLAFPTAKKLGSRVIITTRDPDVAATSCRSPDLVYNLEPLPRDASHELFCLKAFDGKECPRDLSAITESILGKCGGLPLGIIAIGGVLRNKNHTVEEWRKINNSLGTELQGNESLRSIHKILSSSYHDLSHDLKPCFLYMRIFPENKLIEHLKLIRLWVAEGFVAHEEEGDRTADDVAESYLAELLRRSVIEVAEKRSDGRVKSYRIHGLMREILTLKSRAQKFLAISNQSRVSYSMERRLSVQSNHLCGTLFHSHSLRSLLLFDEEIPITKLSMPILFNGGLKLLTVLDLQNAKLDTFPTAITALLNLRYLSLRDTDVKDIPASIGQLQQLETLDLKHTRVQSLPRQIKHLLQLRNLLVYRYYDYKDSAFPSKYGFKAPGKIARLTSLQKLCFVEAGPGSSQTVRELGQLTKLRRLGIIKLSSKNEGHLWSSIQKMTELRALSVTSAKGEKMDLQGLNSPPEYLQRLYLAGQLTSLPDWSRSLSNLVIIFLKASNLEADPLLQLGNLTNLVQIELLEVYTGDKLCFKAGKFQKLKILGIRKLKALNELTIEKTAMPNLEKFLIQDCQLLQDLAKGINHLAELRVLNFVDMPEVVYTRIRPPNTATAEGDDYKSIKHIPQVNFTNMIDNVWYTKRVNTSEFGDATNKEIVKEINNFGKK